MPGSIAESKAAVSLLFSEGERPSSETVREFLGNSGEYEISFAPSESEQVEGEPLWLELLANGLTFDLVGLAPGPLIELPPRRNSHAVDPLVGAKLEAISLTPSPHIATSVGMTPVLRSLAALAADLSAMSGVERIVWHSARSATEPETFRKAVGSWVDGGVFPGLVLTSIALAPDKGLQSEGFSLFTGQDLRIEPELAADPLKATKLAVRLFDLLVDMDPIRSREELVGPDGTRLQLEPSANGLFVRVSRA